MTELFNDDFSEQTTSPQIAIIGFIKAVTVLYNGAVLQRQGATVWYKLNPTANQWEAITHYQDIETNYQKELRRDNHN